MTHSHVVLNVRKIYTSPHLSVYGHLADLTLGGNDGPDDANDGGSIDTTGPDPAKRQFPFGR